MEKGGRILSWGWCHRGTYEIGSTHAEHHALMRSNPYRVPHSTIFVAGLRKESNRVITAKPCDGCRERLRKRNVAWMQYSTVEGWRIESVF